MRAFLLILVFFTAAYAVVASPLPATVTITGNCTEYEYSIIDKVYTPYYPRQSPFCGGSLHRGSGEISPYGFQVASLALFPNGVTGHVEIRTSMALEVVVLGGTGPGFLMASQQYEGLAFPYWIPPPPESITLDSTFGGDTSKQDLFVPFTFGEPIRFTVDTHMSLTKDEPGGGDFPWYRSFGWRMDIVEVLSRTEHGFIGYPVEGAYIVEAAAIPEPSVGLLCGLGLLFVTWRLKRKSGLTA